MGEINYGYFLIGVAVLSLIVYVGYKIITLFRKKTSKTINQTVKMSSQPTFRSLKSNPQPIQPEVEIKTETKKEETDGKTEDESLIISKDIIPNALVFDKARRRFGLRRITMIPGKDYGQTYQRFNYMVFLLEKTLHGEYFPLILKETIEHSPGELYEALQTMEDVRILWGSRSSQPVNFKLWMFILAIVVLIAIAFMSTQAGKGG